MKNLYKALASATLILLAVSCVKETGTETIPSGPVRIYNLTFAGSTRTELSGTGSTRQVSWNEGDVVQYYTSSGQSSPGSATVRMEGEKATIETPRSGTDAFITAVYGASRLNSASSTGSEMYVSSPVKDAQSYTSFPQAHLCAAFSDDVENLNLSFHNAAAIVKLTSAVTVSKIVFRGNGGEVITGGEDGELKISCTGGKITTEAASAGGTSVTVQTEGAESDFYIAILPVNFGSGITVECYDSSQKLVVAKTTTDAINTVSAAGAVKILNLGSVQAWLNDSLLEAVDLGLPSGLKWATCNVGATKPEEYGDYFAWGETEPKSYYWWDTYKFFASGYWLDDNIKVNKYCSESSYWDSEDPMDYKTVLDPEDDAAHVNWGGSWRMPTKAEWGELINKCSWTSTTLNNVDGRLVTGPNGNSIFLPAAGLGLDDSILDSGVLGLYGSSSLFPGNQIRAWNFFFRSDELFTTVYDRYYGASVRPVTE